MMDKPLAQETPAQQLTLLQQGDERGLSYFYERYYAYFYNRALRATKSECPAQSIAQEAFLRLWLYREQIKSVDDVPAFLKTQVSTAITAYYNKTQVRFQRSLLQLDDIDDYQDFLLGYELEEPEEEDLIYLEQLEEEKQERLSKLNNLLPNLTNEQQLFIKLCLKYSFNYERIAHYLGGISDYEVSLQVERSIATLKSAFTSGEKMEMLDKPTKITLEGEFDEQQVEIFRMRYELQYSFDEIADALQLESAKVKTLFIQAHTKIKPPNKPAKNN